MDYDAVRAAANGSTNMRRVEVNQRALIDKILARYATASAVYRELLQNSNDASATVRGPCCRFVLFIRSFVCSFGRSFLLTVFVRTRPASKMMIQPASGIGGVPAWLTGHDYGVAISPTIRLQRPFARP
jgi:hypothetical protein